MTTPTMENRQEFIGIIDDSGLESFKPIDPEHVFFFQMRAALNWQRNAHAYHVRISPEQKQQVEDLIEKEDWLAAKELIQAWEEK
jgi:hypothetical protein